MICVDSEWQVESHPSPLTRLLPSHCSTPALMPSPQTVMPTLGEPLHEYPLWIVQLELHPSPLTLLPSSHCSLAFLTPSPQIAVHTVGALPTQLKPVSRAQAE